MWGGLLRALILFCYSSLPCAFPSKVTYPRGSWDFLLSDKGNVLFSLLIFPPEMPGSLPHRHYSLWFPQPFHWLLPGEKQWKISQGTSPVTSQKAIIIYLHIRAAPVIFYFKKSLFHVLLSRNAAG